MKNKKILIVDDEEDIREILRSYLKKRHFDVLEAANGIEALEVIDRTRPDLIILDVVMPIMDGFEVLKKIRNHAAHSSTPVIMLTIKSDSRHLDKGISLKADFYLPKPFKLENIMRFVKLVLSD